MPSMAKKAAASVRRTDYPRDRAGCASNLPAVRPEGGRLQPGHLKRLPKLLQTRHLKRLLRLFQTRHLKRLPRLLQIMHLKKLPRARKKPRKTQHRSP